MRKVYLSVIGFSLICRLHGHAQVRSELAAVKPPFTVSAPKVQDTSGYIYRPLHVEEINLVSSYYSQDGNHSAITGGIGTQQVTDVSNGLDIKLSWANTSYSTNSLNVGLGIDHHTSASSAFVTTTGKGKQDGSRTYPSLDWTYENTKTGTTFGLGSYYSGEYNYRSLGFDIHFAQKTADKNGEFSVKLQSYLDHVVLIYPSEFIATAAPAPAGATYVTTASGNRVLVTAGGTASSSTPSLASSPRNTYTASFAWSQVINSRLQMSLLADVVTQNGLLSLPYHRVYLNNGKDTLEKLPSSRFKIPLGVRANYFLGDDVILRSYYRYYMDNWDSRSHTVNLEAVFKLSPFFSVSPFYRFYSQSASKYFAPYKTHLVTDQYYTSNYEYAQFTSNFLGIGMRIVPPGGVLGMHQFHELEIRYGHYTQSVDLVSDVISLSLGFK